MNPKDLAARLLATFLGELDDQVRFMNEQLLALEEAPGERDRVHSLFRVAHTLKGAARAAGVPMIDRVCHALESILADARDNERDLDHAELAFLFDAADALEDAGARLRVGTDLGGSPLATVEERLRRGLAADPGPPPAPRGEKASATPTPRDSQVRVDADRLDALVAAGTELLVAAGRPRVLFREMESLRDTAARCVAEWREAARCPHPAPDRTEGTSPGSRPLSVLGEDLERLAGDAARLSDTARADARVIDRVVDDVLTHTRKLRMRPFGEACEALPRAVRDLAKASGKEIDLHIRGADIEADRVVLDGLREALLQLVRNAVDHGVESAPQREAAGKSPGGTIEVVAVLRGDRIEVSVTDDGRGLDVAAIRSELERRGIPVPDDDVEVAQRLFGSRLSTRAEATEVSGRGVGLDVVRDAVDRMGGRVEVRWTSGGGTTFSLDCPVTLATVQALLVSVGSHLVAIPLASVERLLRVDRDDLRLVEGRHVVVAGDGPVPVVGLARLLPPLPERSAGEGPLSVVMVRVGTRRLALVVDEALECRELAVRPIRGGDSASPVVRGAAVLETGRIVLIADPASLVASGLGAEAGTGLTVTEPVSAASKARRILVVDDSITTRTLEASILEAAGYEVLTAVDGSDAWRVLQEKGCDLVVSDIEMPRMDGFALCEAIRGSRRFERLPIVLVTALENPEHRARGLEVGADAYIGKSSFEQENLLDTIQQLME